MPLPLNIHKCMCLVEHIARLNPRSIFVIDIHFSPTESILILGDNDDL